MLFATLAIGMLASCSKDSGAGIEAPIDPDAPLEISLGVKQTTLQTNVKTKGIGGIGDLETNANNWNGETLYIYALSTESSDVVPTNEKATAPTGSENAAITWADDTKHFYYGGTSIYTFYGYHIDDAAGDTPVPTKDDAIGVYSIPFKINGTQDLMVAATDKTADIAASSGGVTEDQAANLYSAWSVRRGVTPNLIFKHLLSRLKFTVKAGNQPTAEANVSITKIEVYSKSEGTLVVVPSADGTTMKQGLTNVTDFPEGFPENLTGVTPFELMQAPDASTASKDLVALQPVVADSKDTPKTVGESMLVIPADSYKMVVTTSQEINGNIQTGTIIKTLEKPSKDGVIADSFVEGNQYTINIMVYGLEEITVNATLTAWKDGGSITIDPDDEPASTTTPQP